MKYGMKGRVRYSESGSSNHITLPAIINYFQDCSTFQSHALGVGVEALAKQRKAWVLSSWQIVADRYPGYGEEITVETWATDFTGVCGTRNFLMAGADGMPAAYANSIWAYMDLERGRPAKPSQEEIDRYGMDPAFDMEYAPRKIRLPEESQQGKAFAVCRFHIDTNGHVNNCQYVQMALEVLETDITVRQVRVEYKVAAVYGDIIYPKIAREEKRIVVELCSVDDKPYAVMEFTGEEVR